MASTESTPLLLDIHAPSSSTYANRHPLPPRDTFASRPLPRLGCRARLLRAIIVLARWLSSPRVLFALVALVFLAEIGCCISFLLLYPTESCLYDYRYLLVIFTLRGCIGLRILYWQTHSSSLEPGTFDRFLKNWFDLIVCIYGLLWTLDSKGCEATAKHSYYLSASLITLIYLSSLLRLLLWVLLYPCRAYINDSVFIVLRCVLKLLNGGSAFSPQLLPSQDILTINELENVSAVKYYRGLYEDEDSLCAICLAKYEGGDELRILHCRHHFHSACVDPWIMEKRRCPSVSHRCDNDHQ